MNRDTVIGIVGSIVLVAAMVGVFQYERARGADLVGDDAAWALASAAGPTAEGTSALGESSPATLAIVGPHVTNVTFAFTWAATNGENTLAFTVTPPEGVPGGPFTVEPSSSGSTTLTVPVPNASPATGSAGALGAGDWQVVVEYQSSTGLAPAPGVPPVQPDPQQAWSVTTTVEAWQLPAASA